jgi:hypothetical protein
VSLLPIAKVEVTRFFYDGNDINVDLTAIADQTDIKIYDMLGGCFVKKYG